MLRVFVLILFFIGSVSLIVGYVNQFQTQSDGKVEYRFIPRTFKEAQNNPVPVTEIFDEMFNQTSEWVRDFKFSKKSRSAFLASRSAPSI